MIFSRSEINIRMNVPAWEGQEVQIASEEVLFLQSDFSLYPGKRSWYNWQPDHRRAYQEEHRQPKG